LKRAKELLFSIFLHVGLLGGALINLALAIRWADLLAGGTITIFEANRAIAAAELAGFLFLGTSALIAFVRILSKGKDPS